MFTKLLQKTQILKFKKSVLALVDNSVISNQIDKQFNVRNIFKKILNSNNELIKISLPEMHTIRQHIIDKSVTDLDLWLRPLPCADNMAYRITNNKSKKLISTISKNIPDCAQYSFLYVAKGSGKIYLEWRDIINRKGWETFSLKENDIIGFSSDIKFNLKSNNKFYSILYKYQINHES
tara:strand:- start:3533 stop:4069 length:537 start_codon:yes stop_codon:yes gene_type:complete